MKALTIDSGYCVTENVMAKTSAQRQQDYRRQRPFAGPEGNGERRLNTWLTTSASLALERLACRYGVTKRQILEQLLQAADEEILAHLEPSTPAWQDYFNPPALRSNSTRQQLISSFPDDFFDKP